MADQFYDDIPARANNIGTDIDQIELSLGWIKDILGTICSYSDSSLTNVVVGNKGLHLRPQFTWKDADEIYISAFASYHAGTTGQMVYYSNASNPITFQFGSGGSNAGSEDLDQGAQEVQYLYIDDSVLVTDSANILTNARLLNSAEAPSWSHSKHGWYPSSNGTYVQTTDKCIGAFLINASNEIVEFIHDGGDYVGYADQISDYSATPTITTWTDVTLSIPGFCSKALVTIQGAKSGSATYYYRTNGQTGTTGRLVAQTANAASYSTNTLPVLSDSSQKIEVYTDAAATTVSVYTIGWYFPVGL